MRQSSPDKGIDGAEHMTESRKELTLEELRELIKEQEGDFIIHIEQGEEEPDADAGGI